MAFAPNPRIVQVELRYDQDNEEIENLLYFDTGSIATQTECALLALEVNGWWGVTVRPLQATTVTLREVYAKVMIAPPAPEATSTAALPAAGTGGTAALPNNVTCSISFRTGFTGRSSRGRNYIIGLMEGGVVANQLNAGVIQAWTAAYEGLLPTGPYITGGTWVVYSQQNNGVPRVTGAFSPVSTVLFVNDVVDSQRRRLPGRGQ
jgi:hypothetical protein